MRNQGVLRLKSRGFRGGLLVLILGSLIIYISALSGGPDVDLEFVREVKSELPAATISKSVHHIINWPKWHHMATDAKSYDIRGFPISPYEHELARGEEIELTIIPKGQTWKTFTMVLKVLDYKPGQFIELAMIRESTGKIMKLLSQMRWRIEWVAESEKSTRIRAVVQARTASWRSRLFDKIARRMMMNQVFWVDLNALAELSEPKDATPPPQHRE
jgi:hypothetical protein